MLTKTQKKYLKGLANTLSPLVTIGKNGLNENVIISCDEVLTAHELLKVSILNTCDTPKEEIALDIAAATHSEIVSSLGRKIVFYRANPDKKLIELPR